MECYSIDSITLLSFCQLLFHRNAMFIPNDERIFKVLFGTAGGLPIGLSQVGYTNLYWLIVWNMFIFHILGMLSSQMTDIFERG